MSSSGTKGSDNRTYYYDKNTGSTKVVDSGGKTVYSGGLNSPTPNNRNNSINGYRGYVDDRGGNQPSTADLLSGNFHENYITGNSLWVDDRVNNAQRAMIEANYYATQAGNASPYSSEQIQGAAGGGSAGWSYGTGGNDYAYVQPYQDGGQNFISPTQRTSKDGTTVEFRGYANEPTYGAYAQGTRSPQDMEYSWERTGGANELRAGTYQFNPQGAASAEARDITKKMQINQMAAAAAKKDEEEMTMRDYMSSYGQTPGWDANTGMVTIGGKQYQSGNIPGTYFDAGTGYHYVTDPTKFNSLLATGTPQQSVVQQPIMPPPEKEEEFQFMMPDLSMYDTSRYIGQLADAQRASRIAALDKARSNAMTALDTEQANIAPVYYDKRNQAAAQSDVGAMNFAQYMAARGIKGAAGAMPEIYRNASLQGQLGALDRQEASQLGAIERQRANVESGYASDVAAAEADIQSQAMQNAINQMNADREFAMQQAALEWEIKRANQERQKAAEDAARQDWLATIGRYADDYQAQINAVQNDGDPSNDWQIPYLQAARQNKISDLDAAAAKAAQQDFENQLALARLNKPSGGGSPYSTSSQIDDAWKVYQETGQVPPILQQYYPELTGGINKSASKDLMNHALNVMESNYSKAMQDGRTEYNFASYITYMQSQGAWDQMTPEDKQAVIKRANELSAKLVNNY